ncbi:hypothetical protein A2U01_0066416, partial [Trifolium medium]|nr:hypothetical protein [Trifolium medium]
MRSEIPAGWRKDAAQDATTSRTS